jgi:Predicted secreted (periplasmic) protein
LSSSPVSAWSRRALLTLSVAATAVFLQACQVRPLYDETSGAAEKLASIGFSEASDRVSQVVGNHLIYLTSGGAGEPDAPEYQVELKVQSQTIGVLLEQSSDTANAGRIVVTGDYTLTKTSDSTVLRTGRRQAVALVDFPFQEFAKLRAVRDAENRAARQLAELIRADLATVLGR